MTLLNLYLKKLYEYNNLKNKLYAILEPTVIIKSVTKFGSTFSPSHTSISEEIKHWSNDAPPIPPSYGWVEPRKGIIKLGEETWEFAFHGAGLSFFHSQTHHDVSFEYTKTGELGITQSTTEIYIETSPDNNVAEDLLQEHPILLAKAISLGYLTKTPPLLGIEVDEQTFIFTPLINKTN